MIAVHSPLKAFTWGRGILQMTQRGVSSGGLNRWQSVQPKGRSSAIISITCRDNHVRSLRARAPSRACSTRSQAPSSGSAPGSVPPAGPAPPPPSSPPPFSPPPFALRTALVGTAVGLATPAFAVGAVAFAWHSHLPTSLVGRVGKGAIGVLLGGGLVTLIWNYFLPFLKDHADLVQPFALANGVAAAFWYALAEWTLGLEVMAGVLKGGGGIGGGGGSVAAAAAVQPMFVRVLEHFSLARGALPVGGLFVGAATGLSAPLLWPLALWLCWPEELREAVLGERRDATPLIDLYLQVALPVALPVSLFSGVGMHYLLRGLLLGSVGGAHATLTASAILAGLIGTGAVYAYTCKPALEDLFWETRVDRETGRTYATNARTGKRNDDARVADDAAAHRALLALLQSAQKPLYQRLRDAVRRVRTGSIADDDDVDEDSYYDHWGRGDDDGDGEEGARGHDDGGGTSSRWRGGNFAYSLGGVDPDLPLAKAEEHARLSLLFDLLLRAQTLRQTGKGSSDSRLKRLERRADRNLGVQLLPLLDALLAAVGAGKASMASLESTARAHVLAAAAADAPHARALLQAALRHVSIFEDALVAAGLVSGEQEFKTAAVSFERTSRQTARWRWLVETLRCWAQRAQSAFAVLLVVGYVSFLFRRIL